MYLSVVRKVVGAELISIIENSALVTLNWAASPIFQCIACCASLGCGDSFACSWDFRSVQNTCEKSR